MSPRAMNVRRGHYELGVEAHPRLRRRGRHHSARPSDLNGCRSESVASEDPDGDAAGAAHLSGSPRDLPSVGELEVRVVLYPFFEGDAELRAGQVRTEAPVDGP